MVHEKGVGVKLVQSVIDSLFEDVYCLDPKVCGGQPCVRGTGITKETVDNCFNAGMSKKDLVAAYPALDRVAGKVWNLHRLESICKKGGGFGVWQKKEKK